MQSFICARAPLFVPADQPARFAKAAESGTDAVIIDLEDAVAAESKGARANLRTAQIDHLPLYVRINGVHSEWFDDDVACVATIDVAAIVLPKAEQRADVDLLLSRMNRDIPVIALIETATGLSQISEILSHHAVPAVAFGSLDFCLDLGCAHTRAALAGARNELVLKSRLAGKAQPIDGVTTNFQDLAVVADDANFAAELGFGGKMLIHPKQIEPTLAAFLPDQKQIDWAKRVLGAIKDKGAASLDGTMIDRPVIVRAERILSLASTRA
ncbi:CoA ester lyase (plasmid) [Rhizobium sp. 32-5/1]|uniref:HpcH/HpaI aldolase/citrate lyase family protein n=1 Tax=Rhizobium sp. 32-5/1 TaxID=3019602 RepID=UPI00240D1C3B|nr:CoA ester lyase [Rhizobium sp. 32-5/1]WEZ85469.1 CoA ester lyase [Rhizobium sp. 32-5/1]